MSTTFYSLANAISQVENSQWPNNPGALEDTSGNPLSFSSISDGFEALLSKLSFDASGQSSVYSPDMSLSDFASLYSGGDANYANNLSSILGVSEDTTLGQLSDQSLGTFNNQTYNGTLPNGTSYGTAGINSPNATSGQGAAQSASNSLLSYFLSYFNGVVGIEADIVAVILGIIFIAGAIFTFGELGKTTQQSVQKLKEISHKKHSAELSVLKKAIEAGAEG